MLLVSLTTYYSVKPRMSARFVVCLCATTAALSPIHEALLSRRTVHNFDNSRAVPDDVLHRAVEAATYAPNHKMTEPWRFRRWDRRHRGDRITECGVDHRPRQGREEGEALGRDPELARGDVAASRPARLLTREDYAAACCAVQNLQLSFAADGIGTKWTSGDIQRTPEFERICGVDGTRSASCGVWYGCTRTAGAGGAEAEARGRGRCRCLELAASAVRH